MSPILFFGTQALVFGHLLGFNKESYWLRLLLGLLPWLFIASSLEMSSSVLVNQGKVIRNHPIPPLLFVLAQVADNLLNIGIAFVFLLVGVAIASDFPGLQLFFFPLAWLPLITFVASSACALSVLNVFFRDIRFVLHFVLQIAFFLTPIFYSLDQLPVSLRYVFGWNPFAIILAPSQYLARDFVLSEFLFLVARAGLLSVLSVMIAHNIWKRMRLHVALRI